MESYANDLRNPPQITVNLMTVRAIGVHFLGMTDRRLRPEAFGSQA
jgi:hypothetical protein